MRSLLLGLTMIAGIPGVVHADIMSSGAAYGGSTQAVAVCYIFNGGTTNLTVTKVDIIKEPFGEIVPVVTQNCNGGCSRLVASVARCPTSATPTSWRAGPRCRRRGSREERWRSELRATRPEQPRPALAERSGVELTELDASALVAGVRCYRHGYTVVCTSGRRGGRRARADYSKYHETALNKTISGKAALAQRLEMRVGRGPRKRFSRAWA